MLNRLLNIYGAINRTFGFTVRPLFTFWLYTWFWTFTTVTLWLDHLFFPGHRKTNIDRPLMIIGTPRSGTTFIHRFLEENFDLCSFRVWQMIVPSVMGQKVLKPFLPFLERFSPTAHAEEVHKTGLTYVETDDALLSVRFIDGFFLFAWFLAWDDRDHTEMFRSLEPGSPQTRRDLTFHEKAVRRLIYSTGRSRFLGKPFVFTMRAPAVIEQYQDAKMIYIVRDPCSVIPSGLSLLEQLSDAQYGIKDLPEDVKQRFFDNLYKGEVLFYKLFHDAYTSGQIPEENLLVVRFTDMMERFEEVMDQITEFAGLEVTEQVRAKIEARGEKQRAYKSSHKYSLEQFGLTEEQVREDLAFVYETFEM